MKARRKRMSKFGRIGVIAIFLMGIFVVFWFFTPVRFVFQSVAALAESRKRLLKETDHQALLAAGREVIAKRMDYNPVPNGVGAKRGEDIDPNDPRIPEVIRRLQPFYLKFEEDNLLIALHGGFSHFGAIVYTEGSKSEPQEGTGKLLDGLWYYAD